jgi:hypothetical protein
MSRRAGSGINEESAERITEFLRYYTEQKDKAEKEAPGK